MAAFFGQIVAYKALALIAGGDVRLGISALLTAACAAGAVYAHERLAEAKSRADE